MIIYFFSGEKKTGRNVMANQVKRQKEHDRMALRKQFESRMKALLTIEEPIDHQAQIFNSQLFFSFFRLFNPTWSQSTSNLFVN